VSAAARGAGAPRPARGGAPDAAELLRHATRERFLRAITERVAPARVAELHLFAPIRQGGVETGVAVIAARDVPTTEVPAAGRGAPPDEEAAARAAPDQDRASAGDSEIPARGAGEVAGSAGTRYTVFTARYRVTLKGPERGKWEFDVVAEAEAPLVTVDAVVRGVQRRAGDDAEAERLTGDALAAYAGAASAASPPAAPEAPASGA
jgi:hypothetical protein